LAPIAHNLKVAMQEAGVGLEELAFRVGVTYRTVQRWLSGESEPRGWEVKLRISETLNRGADPGWLYEPQKAAA
jgi:transcriptional regulator with XRE-family HTH domain